MPKAFVEDHRVPGLSKKAIVSVFGALIVGGIIGFILGDNMPFYSNSEECQSAVEMKIVLNARLNDFDENDVYYLAERYCAAVKGFR